MKYQIQNVSENFNLVDFVECLDTARKLKPVEKNSIFIFYTRYGFDYGYDYNSFSEIKPIYRERD